MPSRRGRVTLAVAGFAVGPIFLWLAVRDADLATVRDVLSSARPGPAALAVVAFAVVYGFQAARWHRVAAAPRVRLARFYEMTISGVAVNNVIPGRIGDVLRARWLGLAARIPAGRAFGTVIIDRACDIVVLVALLLLGIVAVATSGWLVNLAVAGLVLVVLVGALFGFARVYVRGRERDRRSRGLLRRLVRDTVEALAQPLARRSTVLWLLLSLSAWLTWSAAAYLVARSLGIDISFLDAIFVSAVLNLGSAVPSSPGFVGTYEWLGVASLGLLGVGHDAALAFTVMLHVSWYGPTTLAGGGALILRGARGIRRRRRSVARDKPGG